MKHLLLLLAILFISALAHAQQGNTLTIRYAGVPTGTCGPFFLAVNNATSDEYNCTAGGAWNKISSSGGTCPQGICVVNAPTSDQTITGGHALNNPQGNFDSTTGGVPAPNQGGAGGLTGDFVFANYAELTGAGSAIIFDPVGTLEGFTFQITTQSGGTLAIDASAGSGGATGGGIFITNTDTAPAFNIEKVDNSLQLFLGANTQCGGGSDADTVCLGGTTSTSAKLLITSAKLLGLSASLPVFTDANKQLTNTGTVGLAKGGTNAVTAAAALINLFPTASEVGDLIYCATFAAAACTSWAILPGNTSGTKVLQETSAGAPSWVTASSGTVTATGGSLTSNAVVLGAGTTDTKVSTGITTNGVAELDLGVTGTSGVLGLVGTTSGTAKFTAPAVAGTVTNPVASTNVLTGPTGSKTADTYGWATASGYGMYFGNGTAFSQGSGSVASMLSSGSGGVRIGTALGFIWSNTTDADTGVTDTGLTRPAAGVVLVGSGAVGDSSGKLKAAGYMSVGTTFTTNAGCTDTTLVGGATSGKFTIGQSTSCTTIITMGNSATAPNGWSCWVNDQTALATLSFRESASTTTTASFTGTGTSGDVLNFGCMGY